MLDVGRAATNFVACSRRSIFFRSFPLGGDAFTKALVKGLNLTLAAAEEVKRAPWKARNWHSWDEALQPCLRSLVEEIGRSEKLLGRGRRLERLYVAGGGAQLHGLILRACESALVH
jgi:Tfp pilus assembly PilM family ATPase